MPSKSDHRPPITLYGAVQLLIRYEYEYDYEGEGKRLAFPGIGANSGVIFQPLETTRLAIRSCPFRQLPLDSGAAPV